MSNRREIGHTRDHLADPDPIEHTASGHDGSGCDRLLRLPQVMSRVGLKRSAIYQRMREGRFPRSRVLGPRCTVWLESEVDQWVREVASTSGDAICSALRTWRDSGRA